jgi:hypothetical protein
MSGILLLSVIYKATHALHAENTYISFIQKEVFSKA